MHRVSCCLSLSQTFGDLNVLFGPGREAGGKVLIRDLLLPLAELEAVRAAGTGSAEVVLVGVDVESKGAAVALCASIALADLDVGDFIVDGGGATGGQPVLGTGMTVAKEDGRQTGNGIVYVGDAILGAGLDGDEVDKSIVANTGAAVRVKVDGVTVTAEVSSGDGGNSTTEGVASRDDGVIGVGGLGRLDIGQEGVLDLVPGVGEASMDLAVVNKVAVVEGEENVSDPVADVVGATDGNDDVLLHRVRGNVALEARHEAANSVLAMDRRTVAVDAHEKVPTILAPLASTSGQESALQVMEAPTAASLLQEVAATICT